jgi:hypothetical protein
MTTRSKLYYPKSSITENLFTNGGEYMFETGVMYIGYYHKYDTGEAYTRPTWDSNNSIKLIPYNDISNLPIQKFENEKQLTAFLASDLNMKRYKNPITSISIPTQLDYIKGHYYRFFSEKRNESEKITEITKEDYLNSGNIGGLNSFLYKVGKIKWHLIGDEYDTKNENGIVIKRGVLDNNAREVLALIKTYPYIYTIFGDYRQFTQHSRLNDFLYRR